MTEKQKVITDHFGRKLQDLRISVINQCNFRCTYCMPEERFGEDYPFLHESELLSFDEIVRTAETPAAWGVNKIRLTDGEPLRRQNMAQCIQILVHILGTGHIELSSP